MSQNRPDEGDGDDVETSDPPEGWYVEHYSVGHLVVVAVNGEVDALTAPRLTTAIREARAAAPEAGLIVDLPRVEFLASAGVTALLATRNQVPPSTPFGVVAGGSARRSMSVLGLDSVIALYRTVDEALTDTADG
ncbi:anti-anti-sigma factor [Mycolicibacterium sp. BK634]|uniref:STAS domain-containing protein n=1 Tax=Mycolicibacterium sp. BK634 TaxID=2587099 RepID=UPI001790FC83|nr:STAS domain-containing protein [Mycolicibacterium sp. BK634]MBB3751354.1 anti-anti-sigma factor [Mycolicibacterium sp. BK634]